MLVVGMGNDLCRDDGFGIIAARRFAESGTPEGVRVYEAGTGGVGLVHELMDGYETLIILDAVDRGGEPGTLYLLETEVPERQGEFTADMHYTVPSKALIMARALGVLPPRVYILGCQPKDWGLGMELSPRVKASVPQAVERLRALTNNLLSAVSDGATALTAVHPEE